MQQLHGRRRQPGLKNRKERLVGRDSRHARMPGMGLGDDGIAGCDRGREVAAGDGAVGQGKIRRRKHDNRSEPEGRRADVPLGVDHAHPPGALAGGGGGLPQLVEHPRQLDVNQPRFHSQPRFSMGHGHQLVPAGRQPVGITLEEVGDACPG